MVQEAISYLEETPDMKTKLDLIDTLRTVTEGKVGSFPYASLSLYSCA
jgi:26S proteasome regulatory subunit N5